MRFFIALEIANENRAEIQAIQPEVGKILPQAKLTDSSNTPITSWQR